MAASNAREFYLDDGALSHLLSFLDAPSLCAAGMTCRSWNQLASDDYLWRPLHAKSSNPMVNRAEIEDGSVCCQLSEGHHLEPARLAGSSSSMPVVPPEYETKRLSFKEAYAMGHNWKTGRAGRVFAKFPGSSWNSAVRLHPDCNHAVLASAGMGSVDVVHIKTGEKCSQFLGLSSQHMEVDPGAARDALDALYSSVAISPSCRHVAFGGFDGVVRLFDVRKGSLLAEATVIPAMQPAVTALGFCSIQSTQVIASGLADGRVSLSPLQAWQVCLGPPSCSGAHPGSCSLVGCPGVEQIDWTHEPRQVQGPWVTCSLGAGVEVRRIKGECGAGAGLAIVAGTSGGHVKVVDGVAGRVRSSLVGSCSCPVKCLSLHRNGEGPAIPEPGTAAAAAAVAAGSFTSTNAAEPAPHELSRVVYAGFDHGMVGNGHYNAIFAWDVNSAERLALLHPGGVGLQTHRGGRGVCSRRLSSDMGAMVKSVWADGWKVAVSAGKSVTIFETRTWKPLYELSVPLCPTEAANDAASGKRNWGPKGTPLGNVQQNTLVFPTKGAPVGPSISKVGHECFPVSPSKGHTDPLEGPEFASWSVSRSAGSSPVKAKGASERTRRLLEDVSESPGSLIFYGNTLAVGLKNDRYTLVTFQGSPAVAGSCEDLSELHIKRFS